MKTLNSISCLLIAVLWTLTAEATDGVTDDTVEFCAATLIVAQRSQEYELWKTRFDLDMTKVLYFQTVLQTQIDKKRIPGKEVAHAAEQCKLARMEADDAKSTND